MWEGAYERPIENKNVSLKLCIFMHQNCIPGLYCKLIDVILFYFLNFRKFFPTPPPPSHFWGPCGRETLQLMKFARERSDRSRQSCNSYSQRNFTSHLYTWKPFHVIVLIYLFFYKRSYWGAQMAYMKSQIIAFAFFSSSLYRTMKT